MMKRIIINESQFKRCFVNEYLDKNFGMPLYRYLTMPFVQEMKLVIKFGIENNLVQEYYQNGGIETLSEHLRQKFTEEYGVEITDDNEEEYYDYEQEKIDEFFSDLEYDPDTFIDNIMQDYNLVTDLYYNVLDMIKSDNELTYEAPAFIFFSMPRIVKNEWLIHFSDNAYDIAKNGFKYGTQYLDRLAYSGAGDIDNKFGEGYDFAYDATDSSSVFRILGRNVENPKYGNEMVLFRASGVSAWHEGDEETQVIFYGPSAKNIIYIRKGETKSLEYNGDSQLWQVCDVHNNRVIYENGNLEELIEWTINNFAQYQGRIVSKRTNNDFDRNYGKPTV